MSVELFIAFLNGVKINKEKRYERNLGWPRKPSRNAKFLLLTSTPIYTAEFNCLKSKKLCAISSVS